MVKDSDGKYIIYLKNNELWEKHKNNEIEYIQENMLNRTNKDYQIVFCLYEKII